MGVVGTGAGRVFFFFLSSPPSSLRLFLCLLNSTPDMKNNLTFTYGSCRASSSQLNRVLLLFHVSSGHHPVDLECKRLDKIKEKRRGNKFLCQAHTKLCLSIRRPLCRDLIHCRHQVLFPSSLRRMGVHLCTTCHRLGKASVMDVV